LKYLDEVGYTITSIDAEDEQHPNYAQNTTYNEGDKVIYNSKIFEAIVETTDIPTDSINWLDLGYINSQKMRDEYLNTQTIKDGDITIELTANMVDTIALFNLECSEIEVIQTIDNVEYKDTYSMLDVDITNWSEYFTESLFFKDENIIKVRGVFSTQLRIIVKALDGVAKIGMMRIGRLKELGATLYSPNISIEDYSKKETDSNGNVYIQSGYYSKKASIDVIVDNHLTNKVVKTLAKLRDKLTLFVAEEKYDGLVVFGICGSFSCIISNSLTSRYSIDLKGVI
jgi:hypothetical protein